MRAIRIEEQGGPEVMKLADVPTPSPAAGQALVRMEAAGVNFIDIYQRDGAYKLPLPFTPGQEGAGVVEAVAPGVTEVKAGDRVAWAGPLGSYATPPGHSRRAPGAGAARASTSRAPPRRCCRG